MAKLETRYGDALLDLAEESGTLELELEQAILVRDILKDNEILSYLTHPHVPDTDKHTLIDKGLQIDLADNLRGLLHLMIRKSRETLIVSTLDTFITEANRRMGRIEARVVSATELDEDGIEAIRRVLEKQSGCQVTIHASVDPDVIGGFYILIEGYVYDATIRSELNQIRERLKRGGRYAS